MVAAFPISRRVIISLTHCFTMSGRFVSSHAMNTSVRQVSLPDAMCVAVERKFGNLESFLTFAMNEVLRDQAAVFDQHEQRIVEERLRDLGYI